ncbi:TrmB family transcriptional regulator [Jiangella ureilytica]|uniref:TrmB family transcriptional regulator n=1 Tax=Jiangella ureilytica TaxID=2530374 RepID=A0A4R4RJ73_9ACTN|nr:helix-turn-helix domain-containing protein [Jiangella ureilytica]TDC49490.1 TrmB family transcriptional regulator [Jiangella ureilytica]
MLEGTGITADEEQVYRLLVRAGEACADDLAAQLRLSGDGARAVLDGLLARGLARRLPGGDGGDRFAANPPDVAFGPLLLRGQESLDQARAAVAELAEEHLATARRRDAGQLLEIVTGGEAIRQRIRAVQLGTRSEMLWFCRAGHVAMPSEENDEEFDMLARGVSYRVLYERQLLEEPGMIDNVAKGIEAGEQARSVPTLPIRLAISDRSVAICPLVPRSDGITEPTAAIVRDSNLLTALIALFESYWSAAAPLLLSGGVAVTGRGTETGGVAVTGPWEGAGPATALSGDERYLLSLLVAGVSDKAIATRLGVSMRTVQRRIRDLMELASAETRMQLAWQVARRGWLT